MAEWGFPILVSSLDVPSYCGRAHDALHTIGSMSREIGIDVAQRPFEGTMQHGRKREPCIYDSTLSVCDVATEVLWWQRVWSTTSSRTEGI